MTPAGTSPDPDLVARWRQRPQNGPLTVAHRGDSESFPENTLPAFEAAVRVGAEVVELDTRQTLDGIFVCMHDETLDRTTDSATVLAQPGLKVQELSSKDIERLDAGSFKSHHHAGTRVPTLSQALDVIQAESITMIEHKAGDAHRLVSLLRAKSVVGEVLVQSFDWDWLEAFHRLEPKTAIAALGSGQLTDERLTRIVPTGATVVHWDKDDLRLEDIATLHGAGYLVCTYTVDLDLALVGAAAMGIDMVTTNRPGRLRTLVTSGQAQRSSSR